MGELEQMQKTSISEKECRTENDFFYFLNKEWVEVELEEMKEQDFPINSESKHHLPTFFFHQQASTQRLQVLIVSKKT